MGGGGGVLGGGKGARRGPQLGGCPRPLRSAAMCRLYCPLLPPLQQEAAACMALVPAPLPPPLCYFKWSSASWALECLSPGVSATYGGTAAAKTPIPRMPRGVDRVSYYNTQRGGGGGGGLPAASGTGLTGTPAPLCLWPAGPEG